MSHPPRITAVPAVPAAPAVPALSSPPADLSSPDASPDASPHAGAESRLLPSVALQGAVGTLGGFLGFFVVGTAHLAGMIRFTAVMLTVAMLSIVLAYALGPSLRLTGRRLFKTGFILPGILLLSGGSSYTALAAAFGAYVGLTSSARTWLEMGLLPDEHRDRYATRAGVAGIVLSLAASFAATLLLAVTAQNSQYLCAAYGIACIVAGYVLGNRLPDSQPVSLQAPLAVLADRNFLACLPIFFLQSGLYGISLSLNATGATQALGEASRFGMIATVATLAGGVALLASRNARRPGNRHYWMAAAALGMMASFLLLAASAKMPKLFLAYIVLYAVVTPFWAASEAVLNQRTLDTAGALQDRIVVREVVLWTFRMIALGLFWLVSTRLPGTVLLAYGATMMAGAVVLQYVIARAWLKPRAAFADTRVASGI